MAKGNYVRVSDVINPYEGLSKSLTNLSNMYGNQAVAEEEQKLREAQERRALTAEQRALAAEQRAQLDYEDKAATRKAQGAFNIHMANFSQGDQVYDLDDYDKETASLLRGFQDNISKERAATRAYLTGDGSEESLNNIIDIARKNLDKSNVSAQQKKENLATYRRNLLGAREQLASYVTDEERAAVIENMLNSKYSAREDSIKEYIGSGRDLLHRERVAAAMRDLPPEVLNRLDYATIRTVLDNKITGVKAEDLMLAEDQRVSDANKALSESAARNAQLISRAYSGRNVGTVGRKGPTTSGLKEVKEILAHEGIYSIGPEDNVDIDIAIRDMLSQGIHPAAVATAIGVSIDRGLFDDTFPEKGSKTYQNFATLAKTLDGRFSTTSSGGVSYKDQSTGLGYTPVVRKDLETLRRERMRITNPGNTSLGVDPRFLPAPVVTPRTAATTLPQPATASTTTSTASTTLPTPTTTVQTTQPTTPTTSTTPVETTTPSNYSGVDRTVGGIEAARSILAGMVAEPVAGLAGLFTSLNPFTDARGADVVNQVRDAFAVSNAPEYAAGREYLNNIGEFVAPVAEVAQDITEGAGEVGYRLAGPTGGAIGQAIPAAIASRLGYRGAKPLTQTKVQKADAKVAKAEAAAGKAATKAEIIEGKKFATSKSKVNAKKDAETAAKKLEKAKAERAKLDEPKPAKKAKKEDKADAKKKTEQKTEEPKLTREQKSANKKVEKAQKNVAKTQAGVNKIADKAAKRRNAGKYLSEAGQKAEDVALNKANLALRRAEAALEDAQKNARSVMPKPEGPVRPANASTVTNAPNSRKLPTAEEMADYAAAIRKQKQQEVVAKAAQEAKRVNDRTRALLDPQRAQRAANWRELVK